MKKCLSLITVIVLVLMIQLPVIASSTSSDYNKEIVEKVINYVIDYIRNDLSSMGEMNFTTIILESPSDTAGMVYVYYTLGKLPGCAIVEYKVNGTSISIVNMSFTFSTDSEEYKGEGIVLNTLSEKECKEIALNYFNNLSWKNPSSVVIHDISQSYSIDGIMFIIDYSAQNGFGGYNRKSYIIQVDFNTGDIVFAYSS